MTKPTTKESGIPFTQSLRPDGHRTPITIDRPAEIESLARKLIEEGCSFEIEELRTGIVSMTCERDARAGELEDPVVLAHELCPNGPRVPRTVDTLVIAAARNPDR